MTLEEWHDLGKERLNGRRVKPGLGGDRLHQSFQAATATSIDMFKDATKDGLSLIWVDAGAP